MLTYLLIAAGGYFAGLGTFRPWAVFMAWLKLKFQTKVAGL